MGPAGAGSVAEVVNQAIAGKQRMNAMRDFFAPAAPMAEAV